MATVTENGITLGAMADPKPITEGPWVVREITPDHHYYVSQRDENTSHVAEVYSKANADLIAAVPDLLAACEALTIELESRPLGHTTSSRDAIRIGNAAIAKARGAAVPA